MKKSLWIVLSLVLVLTMAFSSVAFAEGYDEELVIYTNSGSGGRDVWLMDLAAENGFNITIVEGGGGDIFNRVIAEKNAPVADVVFGLNMLNFAEFKKQDMLMQFVPTWAEEVDDAMKDVDGYHHGIVKQAIVLVYNPDVYTEDTAPKDWPDLWTNPEFSGKYNIFGLGGGTSRTALSGIAMRFQDPEGEYGISDEGWENIKAYIQNGYFTADGEDYIVNLKDETVPMTMLWGSGVVSKAAEYETEFGVMNPEVGVPFVVEQVAILKDTDSPEAAKAFVEWFGSSEVQALWAQAHGTSPANSVAMESAQEDAVALDEYLTKAQYIDWGWVLENVDYWVEKIELEYME